jgi:hypothetical protein
MSSEIPPTKRLIDAATDLGEQALRKVGGGGDRSRGGRGRAPTGQAPGTVAGEGAAGAADLARDAAGLALRAAVMFGERALDFAGQLESKVGDAPAAGARREPYADRAAASGPLALMLGSTSPGGTVSKSFDVRNDSFDRIDGMRLRCDGLFGAGGRHISATSIRFSDDNVAVAPSGTARVECTVDVPAGATRGTYTGLIEAADRPGVQLLVSLTVI